MGLCSAIWMCYNRNLRWYVVVGIIRNKWMIGGIICDMCMGYVANQKVLMNVVCIHMPHL